MQVIGPQSITATTLPKTALVVAQPWTKADFMALHLDIHSGCLLKAAYNCRIANESLHGDYLRE